MVMQLSSFVLGAYRERILEVSPKNLIRYAEIS